ncbi:MAG TPA: NF038122 family metalloprotease [Alphaproteobacteria bacterium]|nr:NF038122 family metalloprotease [Alphaproteobacteria bacterium]
MLFDTWFESHLGGGFGNGSDTGHNGSHEPASTVGQEYLLSDSGALSAVKGPTISAHGGYHPPSPSAVPGTPTSPPPPPPPPPPAGTLVGAAGGLQIDLIWDSSVASAPAGFQQAIITAAQYLASLSSTAAVLNIQVGYGEVGGTAMSSGALGESESYGYLTGYATVVNALAHDNYPVAAASNAPTGAQFFVTSAEAKAMGLASATASSVDGFIGLSSSYPLDYSTSGSPAGSTSYSAVGVAEHELSEVMGRIGMEGRIFNGAPTYTPLDLFNYASAGHLELSGGGGYFSVSGGSTALGTYNNSAANGGDIADWASGHGPVANDAFNAYTSPGPTTVSSADVQEIAALGYKLTATGSSLA